MKYAKVTVELVEVILMSEIPRNYDGSEQPIKD